MNARSMLSICILIICVGLTPMRGTAAESTVSRQRKKLKLHAIGIAFQTVGMSSPKRISRPSIQNIGLITSDQVALSAHLDPAITLPASRFIWGGAASGQGPVINVSYGSEGNRVVNLTVRDTRGEKITSAATRVRFVSDQTQNQFCFSSVELPILCEQAVIDALLATTFSQNPTTVARVGLASPDSDHGRTNAARHAYWNVLLARDFSAMFARALTTAHERDGLNANAPHPGTVMDLENNASGRAIAAGMTFSSTPYTQDVPGQDAVIAAVNAGSLTILDDISNAAAGLLQPSNQ